MRSWGGLPEREQRQLPIAWQDQVPEVWRQSTLAVGCGRSYGDSALAASGTVLDTRRMDCILGFDREAGLIRWEAGVTLGQIMSVAVPRGWMLPVLPGTRFVTVAGALANDVHGKNHHRAGTFAGHVRELALLRSDGERIQCSPRRQQKWFAATCGGLGLTGVMLWLEIQLRPLSGPWLEVETTRFRSPLEFLELSAAADSSHEYTVGWFDCLSANGRGLLYRARHAAADTSAPRPGRSFSVPFTPPLSPLNRPALRVFNGLYFHRQSALRKRRLVAWPGWFFPLDALHHWNRLYGRRGFRQYQCVVPAAVLAELLAIIRRSGQGSPLAVLKVFGSIRSPALLSFPRPGVTLALDFPWRGQRTTELFRQLDEVVFGNGGAIYPAKDAHMSGADFRAAYPAWEKLEKLRDPKLNSLFWQRVTGAA